MRNAIDIKLSSAIFLDILTTQIRKVRML